MSKTIKNARRFLNPYYFIPLPQKKAIAQEECSETYTGKITYEIVTRTPLFIPNSSCAAAFGDMGKHKSYDFYSYRELAQGEACKDTWEPVIPGSEVRGMLRSVYEAVTGSCMSGVNADMPIFYRGGMRDALNPGLLRREGDSIVLIEAEAAYWNKQQADQTDYVDGQKLFYQAKRKGNRKYVRGRPSAAGSAGEYGYLLRGENGLGLKKKNVAIFRPAKKEAVAVFDKAYQDDFEKLLQAYQKDSDSYHAYMKEYQKFLKGKKEEYFPVYFKKKFAGRKEFIHVAPAAIPKWRYANRVRDLLGDMNPCHINDGVCPACILFGTVDSESKRKGIASRLRFADVRLERKNEAGNIYCEPVNLQELAGPHLSNAQMYLKQPEGAGEWNYDYRGEINGRKFYWHHAKWNIENIKAEKNTDRNVTVRPVADGVTFTGELFFDHITQRELKQMLYLCDISRSQDLGYKLGMGKPLGLGSIEMRIRSVKIRSFSPAEEDFYREKTFDFPEGEASFSYKKHLFQFVNEKSELTENSDSCRHLITYEEAGFLKENHIKDWFEMLMGFRSTNDSTISYPYTDKQTREMEVDIEGSNGKKKIGGFQWFVINKGLKTEKQCLVKAGENKVKLPYLYVFEIKSGGNHSHNQKKGDQKQNYRQGKQNDQKTKKKG